MGLKIHRQTIFFFYYTFTPIDRLFLFVRKERKKKEVGPDGSWAGSITSQ